ncbi:helix-turn-helix transcriptional regulator [Microbacterium invictum]|uniref:Transcriptional regulator with XRE-family HTH domain n=1 Tax=Microbacterium invictum TaxID=515415 RepID=A0AA40SRV2_9MICO|nr:helix-turn-helix transcriptional regulator [Microbacterium invictum]MBB4141306.1 transcriptional regulator with XRE-family HTH domain [Microbacterium invictum]
MDNRHEVQDFLTGLRGRITPEVAGITAFGGERRVPGLRREEVAQLAGVSTAYYTRMERGDLGGVSESVLYALVNALQLNEAETQHLFDLARNATGVGRPSRTKPATRLSPQLEQLLDTMRDVPVVALSRLGDPMGSNSLGRALFLHLFPEGTTPLNTARYLFLDPRSQEFYPDWDVVARESVSAMRLLAGQDPSDRKLAALVGELATRSSEFRTWWGSHTVRTHTTGIKRIAHPVVGEMALTYQTLALPSAPKIRLATYLAERGSSSADALDLLRSWAATPSTAAQESRTS